MKHKQKINKKYHTKCIVFWWWTETLRNRTKTIRINSKIEIVFLAILHYNIAVIRRGNKRIVCVIGNYFAADLDELVFYNAVVFKHGVADFGYVAVCIVFIRGVAVFDKESPAVILIRMIAELVVRDARNSAEFVCGVCSVSKSRAACRDSFCRNNMRELLERFAVL